MARIIILNKMVVSRRNGTDRVTNIINCECCKIKLKRGEIVVSRKDGVTCIKCALEKNIILKSEYEEFKNKRGYNI